MSSTQDSTPQHPLDQVDELAQARLAALNRVQAIIEFSLDGTILTANDNFSAVMGYSVADIQGQHHRMFVDEATSESEQYRAFWANLRQGEPESGVFKRFARGGREIWLQASYNPIFDAEGNVVRIVKFATDVTAQKLREADAQGQMDAISRALAVIEFNLDGTIITANGNFLQTVGYTLDEIRGQHHRMFAEPDYARSPKYRKFWKNLNEGNFDSGVYKRLGKGGKEVWIQASYNPIFDPEGKPFKVVKFATDITHQMVEDADRKGKVDAIGRSQAVIEFNLDGTIITANDNFLGAVGYSLEEIRGKHHRMFVEPAHARSGQYADFWRRLNHGEFDAGVYKRFGKGGREIWIQASYNPILDPDGEPVKVVKFATDVTQKMREDADFRGKNAAVSKSQAVIEFNLDGTIITANDNFLGAVGYSLEEIRGKHHRMFVDSAYGRSSEYAEFWHHLNAGEFHSGVYKRFGKGNKEIWIQASYNPILDLDGNPFKIVKFATDVTAQKLQDADYQGQIEAVSKAQAVIEFTLDGRILSANDNFLNTLGYSLHEVEGRHHRMFVDPEYAKSTEYLDFWRRLKAGEFSSGTYKRFGKGGKEIWIQASYNPILDLDGRPFKVVKFATDITEQVHKDTRFRTDMDMLQDHMHRVAQGDLTAKIKASFEGDHAPLREVLNETLDALNDTLSQVSLVAENVSSGSHQVSSTAQTLAEGATRQAAALREITATMTQLTDQTQQNAQSAKIASELSNDARDTAASGDGMMKNMVTAMAEIDESSQGIRKIIKVIDEIAFQTNLLALNAAVEAARAGVHGKGFAVVAEEVRSLAARSAKAAKETTEMIENSIKKVELGTSLANQTAAALTKIVDGVGKVTDLAAEIAVASTEQARAITDVNEGVSQVDSVTQTNTASAEESSAASQQLSQQAGELKTRLGRFQLAQASDAIPGLPEDLPPELLAAVREMLGQDAPDEAESANDGLGSRTDRVV